MKAKVVVYSDYVCPFCYIGKRRVDMLKEEIDIDVEWKGFELHPETPKEGRPRTRKTVSDNIKILAKEVNLTFNLRSLSSNSKLSLKTGEFAKTKNKFEEYHEATFQAYFQEKKDIGDIEVIKEIVEKIGLDIAELKNYLNTDEADKILERHKIEARKDGIYAVPTFIIGDKKIIGAQPYDIIKRVIETS
jgi:predicted DsbA family dithiol-disulfide isomerase